MYKPLANDTELPKATIYNISDHSIGPGGAQELIVSGANMPSIVNKGYRSKTDTNMRYLKHYIDE
jgi:hypothetical protein